MSSSVRQSLALLRLPEVFIPSALGLLLGMAVLRFSPLWVIAALLAILLVIAMLKRPELILLGLLIGTSTIIGEASMPRVSFGAGRLYVTDLLIVALFGLIILHLIFDPRFKLVRTPLDLPLLAFYGVALLSTLLAIKQSAVTFNESLGELRTINSFLLFFMVTHLLSEERQLRLLCSGLLFLAMIVAAAMMAQYLLGSSLHLLAGRVETLETSGKGYEGIVRILPPGEPLVLLAFMLTAASLILDKFRLSSVLRFLQWSLFGGALVLTFRRSIWLGMGLGLLWLGYVVKRREKLKYVAWGIAVLVSATIGVMLVFTAPDSKAAKLTSAFLDRLETFTESRTYAATSTSTLRWRDFEYKYALPQIAAHPVLGLGLGAEYRPYLFEIDHENFNGRRFTHNGHVYIMLKSGLLGYGLFLWVSLTVLLRGFKYWRRLPDRRLQAIVLGVTLTYLAAFISAISEPRFMDWTWTPVLGIMMGMNEIIFMRFARKELAIAN